MTVNNSFGKYCFLFQLNPPPAYLQERIKFFDQLKAEYDAEVEGLLISSFLVGCFCKET